MILNSPISQIIGNGIAKGLPGMSAFEKMAPVWNGLPFRSFKPSKDAKKGAVLVLINESNSKQEILFTLRSSKLRSHAGQISFPGGRCEDGETMTQAALREANEEVGLDISKVSVIGQLSELFIPPSNSLITPIIATTHDFGNLYPNPDEVETIFTKELEYFLEPRNIKREKWQISGKEVDVPHWDLGIKVPLWGASAIILSELIEIVNNTK